MPTPQFDSADPALIEEVILQAERRLDAQLTVGIAADQRAMTFAGLLFAAVALLVGLAFSASTGAGHRPVTICVTAGFFVGAVLACISARPVGWHLKGNYPSAFARDVNSKKSLADTRSETASNFEMMLEDNDASLKRASRWMRASMVVSGVSAVAGIISAL